MGSGTSGSDYPYIVIVCIRTNSTTMTGVIHCSQYLHQANKVDVKETRRVESLTMLQ